MLNTKNDIINWLDSMEIKNYQIHDNLIIDVNESVDISERQLIDIPVQFGTVNGNFNCFNNELKSLKGVPYHIKGEFYASRNLLNNLEFLPLSVEYNIDLAWNQFKNALNLLPLLSLLKNSQIQSVFLTLEQEVKAFENISFPMCSHAMDEIYINQFAYEFEAQQVNELSKYLTELYQFYQSYQEKMVLEKQISSNCTEKNIKL
jgi:hypothetical protein